VPAKVVVVPGVVLGVLGISKRVGGAAVERVPLWPVIYLDWSRFGAFGWSQFALAVDPVI